MLTGKSQAFRSHPSLLTLRMALSVAESESPSRPPRTDVNEQLAVQLIEKMKADYKKPLPILNWNDIPSQYGFREHIQEMTSTHAS